MWSITNTAQQLNTSVSFCMCYKLKPDHDCDFLRILLKRWWGSCCGPRYSHEKRWAWSFSSHRNDVIMSSMASQINSLTIVYPAVYSGEDQRKHQSSASLAFVRENPRSPVNSPHKWPVTPKMFPIDNVIMPKSSMYSSCDIYLHIHYRLWLHVYVPKFITI